MGISLSIDWLLPNDRIARDTQTPQFPLDPRRIVPFIVTLDKEPTLRRPAKSQRSLCRPITWQFSRVFGAHCLWRHLDWAIVQHATILAQGPVDSIARRELDVA